MNCLKRRYEQQGGVVVVHGCVLMPCFQKNGGIGKRRTFYAKRNDKIKAAKEKRLIEKARAEKIERDADRYKISGSRMSSGDFKDFLNKHNIKF